MSRVVVTGAAGRVGRHVVAELSAAGDVIGWGTVDGVRTVDLTDHRRVVAEMIAARPDVVVHLASGGSSVSEEEAARDLSLLSAVISGAHEAGAARLIFASSAAVYGDSRPDALSESSPVAPASPYGRAKVAAEALLEAASLSTVALRIFNVFGPGMTQSLVSKLTKATPAAPVELRGLDTFVRDYVDVRDVARATRLATTASGLGQHEVINIGSGVAMSNRDLVATLGIDPWVVRVTDGPPSRSVADVRRAREVLGFSASLEPGMAVRAPRIEGCAGRPESADESDSPSDGSSCEGGFPRAP